MKDISSSGIRRVAAAGEYAELAQLVPAPVAEYIRKYELYRDTNETELHS
jgi:nicotinic acid mononucleotide adenylyltransferase